MVGVQNPPANSLKASKGCPMESRSWPGHLSGDALHLISTVCLHYRLDIGVWSCSSLASLRLQIQYGKHNSLGCCIILINIMKFYLVLLYLIPVKGQKMLWPINTTEDICLSFRSTLHSVLLHRGVFTSRASPY